MIVYIFFRNHLSFLFLRFVFKMLITGLILRPKWSDLCHFYSKLEFWKTFNKYILICFTDFRLLMFQNNIVKISEILNKKNLLKTCIQTICPINFCIVLSHLIYYRKSVIFFIKKKNNNKKQTNKQKKKKKKKKKKKH